MGYINSLLRFCDNSNEKLLDNCNSIFGSLKSYSENEVEFLDDKIRSVIINIKL